MKWNITIRNSPRRRSSEKGYTLLFAVFLVAITIISGSAMVLSLKTQAQREKEIDMIWRGEQYKRAIRRYVQKFGRYPTRIDDLVKPTNGVRFLRAAYKDPTNKEDGSWRFIYVTQAGALIGSVRYVSLAQMAMMDQMAMRSGTGLGAVPGMSALGGALGSGAAGQPGGSGGIGGLGIGSTGTSAPGSVVCQPAPPGSPGSDTGSNPSLGVPVDTSGQTPPGGGAAPNNCPPGQVPVPGASGGTGSNGFGFGPFGSQSSSSIGQPQTLGTPLETTALGGNIIGVGSKNNAKSLKVYKRGKTYKEWEFIYNPLEQAMMAGGSSGPAGAVPAQGSTFPSSGQGTNTSPFGGQGNGTGNSGFGGSNGNGFGTPPTSELQQPPNQQQQPQQPQQ